MLISHLIHRYGVGYHMVVVKEAECNSAKVTELVKFFVRGAEQVTDVGAELSFVLPSASASSFPAVFDALEGILELAWVCKTGLC